MKRSRLVTLLLLVLIVTTTLWLSAVAASAHAFLASSEPAANAVVPSAPQVVTLRFTEPLEPSYSRAELYDETGTQVAGVISTVAADPFDLTVSLPPDLPAATYAVMWRSLSATDGHTAQGYFPFTVGTLANVIIVTPPADSAPSGLLPAWAPPATRWLALLALAALVAIWPVWLMVVRPAVAPVWQVGPTLMRRVRRYTMGIFLFFVLASANVLLAQALTTATPTTVPAAIWSALTTTYVGAWWLIRIALLLVLGAVLLACTWWWPQRRRWSALLALGQEAAVVAPGVEHPPGGGLGRAHSVVVREPLPPRHRHQVPRPDRGVHLREEAHRHLPELAADPLVRVRIQVGMGPQRRPARAVGEAHLPAHGVVALAVRQVHRRPGGAREQRVRLVAPGRVQVRAERLEERPKPTDLEHRHRRDHGVERHRVGDDRGHLRKQPRRAGHGERGGPLAVDDRLHGR